MKRMLFRGFLAVWLGLVLGVSITLAPSVLAEKRPETDSLPWEEARLLAEVIERVKRDYVDLVDDEELITAAIRGIIADLDPHSAFLDPAEFQDIRVSTSGRYFGVGIEVGLDDGRIIVVSPVDGSPAARAGILAGDIILSVDGMPVGADDLDGTAGRMRGPVGTRVVLGLRRAGTEEPLIVELHRGQIEVQSVRGELLEAGDAYVRVSHFTDATPHDLRKALRDLELQAGRPLSGLVLDLRSNPGGVLDAAVAVADAFLDSGLIVSAEGRMTDARFRINATPGDLLNGAPLTVLVDRGSASAAEIVAGALKDHRRATIIGTPTYGKGSVQTIMPLSEGNAIKLTTSRYFTPSGMSIHARGVTPDVVVEAAGPGEEDAQLASALAALLGRRVVLRTEIVTAEQHGD
ncbi:MAG TPA: S41 family peptidase [Gammaproteobacteria bacterium]|nr:S41 family peptidase [Gammaproteobacteria bacterium]